jgi:prepilin-type N-terminal cleavage/methylation domain-containing protein
MPKNKTSRCKAGFTLVEALIALAILGFAITALLVANQSYTAANAEGLELSTAEFLIEQIREATVATPFAQLQPNYGGKTFSPPHDSQGNPLTAYSGYSQKITVQNTGDFGPIADFYNITVEIYLNNKKLSSANWIRANY